MATAAVQHRSIASASVTSIALAFVSSNAAGNLLAYVASCISGTPTISAATDSNTNTIANTINYAGLDGISSVRVDYVANCNSGANTATGHFTGTGTGVMFHIWEISGCVTTSPVRDTGTKESTTYSVNTAGTTSQSGDAVLGIFYANNGGSPTLTAGTGFSPSESATDTTDGVVTLTEYKSATASGTQTATCTSTAALSMEQVIVVFIQAVGTTYDNAMSLALSTSSTAASGLALFNAVTQFLALDYSLRGSGILALAGGFEKTAFENTAFYVLLGNSYSNSIALALTTALADNYALTISPSTALSIVTADVVTNQLNAVATVSLPAAVSAAIVGNYIASMVLPALSITAVQTTAKTLGISVANTLATTTALAILGGQNVAAAITAALSTSMTDSASITVSGLASYAITLNAVVTALLNVNGSASFAASLLETSSAVLNAVASEQFALTMSEVASGSLNINAVEALAAALQYNTLAGFTFSSAMALPASLAYALSSSFAYLVSTPLSITTAYSASTLKTAAGLVTLGITTGYALAQSLNAVGSANFPVTTNDVVSTAGSVYGVSIPLHITAQVADVATGVFNSLISMGIHPTLATQAVNIIVQAIAFGITTGMSDDAVKNALQIAALIAEAVTVVQQLTAELVINEQQITAAAVSNVQNIAADSVQNVQQLTAESVTHI